MSGSKAVDPFGPSATTSPEEAWMLTPDAIYIGGHWYAHRPWLPTGDRVGEHLAQRCCVADAIDTPAGREQLDLQAQMHGEAP